MVVPPPFCKELPFCFHFRSHFRMLNPNSATCSLPARRFTPLPSHSASHDNDGQGLQQQHQQRQAHHHRKRRHLNESTSQRPQQRPHHHDHTNYAMMTKGATTTRPETMDREGTRRPRAWALCPDPIVRFFTSCFCSFLLIY